MDINEATDAQLDEMLGVYVRHGPNATEGPEQSDIQRMIEHVVTDGLGYASRDPVGRAYRAMGMDNTYAGMSFASRQAFERSDLRFHLGRLEGIMDDEENKRIAYRYD